MNPSDGEFQSELERAILAGWPDCRAEQLPQDWRNRKPRLFSSDFMKRGENAQAEQEAQALAGRVLLNEAARQERAMRRAKRRDDVLQRGVERPRRHA